VHLRKLKTKNIDEKTVMKLIKSIIDFLIFNWTKSYKIKIPVSDFLSDLKKVEYKKRNIEGEITDSGFQLFFISDFALKFPTKIPFIEIKGELKKHDDFSRLKIRTSIQPFAKYIFVFGVIIVLTIFFLDKYTDFDFGDFTNSNFRDFSKSDLLLIFPFFVYGFLMLNFIIESVSCKDYFSRLILEFEKKREKTTPQQKI